MAKITVPSGVVDGLIAISLFDSGRITAMADYLQHMPVGTKFEDIDIFLNTKLGVEESDDVVRTLVSFGGLFDQPEADFVDIAREMVHSLKSSYPEKIEHVDLTNLEFNLEKIFENYSNLRTTVKALNIVLENSNLYVSGKILTDIRLIFNENITDSNRSAVIFHKLHLTLQSADARHETYITMDRKDLKKLKESIDRALLKEELIKEDYENINFINYY